jgi:hypothetical protein
MAQTQIIADGNTIGTQSSPRTIAAGATESLYLSGSGNGMCVVMVNGHQQQPGFSSGVQLNGPLTYTVMRVAGYCGCVVES